MKRILISCIFSSLASALPYLESHAPRADDVFEPPTFGYDGLNGPLNWHALSENNTACAAGKHQSPIALDAEVKGVSVVKGDTLEVTFEDVVDGAEVVNKGTTLEVSAKGSLTLGGEEYALQQFHFHTPSEHHIEGEVFAMEAHFVFQTEDESTTVIGIMLEVTPDQAPSPFFTNALARVEDTPNAGDTTVTGPLLSKELEPIIKDSDIYQYDGSLTTPPCTEGVKWSVVKDPAFVSAETFAGAKGVMGFNARYKQNAPGERNLLDNAAETIAGSGENRGRGVADVVFSPG